MSGQPLISVIIPVYNHAHTLERSLFCLLEQTYHTLEIIIVDDGSTDDFLEVKKRVLADGRYENLPMTFIHQENRGANAARNAGFARSKGEFVIFWDADTIAKPEMLDTMMTALAQSPAASYAYSGFKFGWKKFWCQPFNAASLQKNNYIDVTSLIRRRDFSGFDEALVRFQDWDLWLSMLEKEKMGVYIPKILYKKIVFGRKGYSSWLPSWFYRLPWKTKKVKEYEAAKAIVLKKHQL